MTNAKLNLIQLQILTSGNGGGTFSDCAAVADMIQKIRVQNKY